MKKARLENCKEREEREINVIRMGSIEYLLDKY